MKELGHRSSLFGIILIAFWREKFVSKKVTNCTDRPADQASRACTDWHGSRLGYDICRMPVS